MTEGDAERIEIRPSRGWNMAKLTLLCGGLTAICMVMLISSESWVHMAVGAIGVGFFGGGGGFTLWSMARTPWTIAFAPDALEIRVEDHVTRVPWDDIEDVGQSLAFAQRMPSIRLARYDGYIASHTPETARVFRTRRKALGWAAGATMAATGSPSLAGHAFAADIEAHLRANRELTGYDLNFTWTQIDRPAKVFTRLLEREWRARRSG